MKARTIIGFTAASIVAAYGVRRAIQYATARGNRGVASGKRIVILGAGFAGREAAAELAKLLPDPGNGEITLVDSRPTLLFTPMLTEAVGGEVKSWHITSPVALLPRRVRFLQSDIEGIDADTKVTSLRGGGSVAADQLVVALGSSSNFHHAEGVEQVAFTLKTVADADAICRRAIQRIDEAEREPDAAKRKELLTFVVAGGGYTGVEAMAALNDLVRDEIGKRPLDGCGRGAHAAGGAGGADYGRDYARSRCLRAEEAGGTRCRGLGSGGNTKGDRREGVAYGRARSSLPDADLDSRGDAESRGAEDGRREGQAPGAAGGSHACGDGEDGSVGGGRLRGGSGG